MDSHFTKLGWVEKKFETKIVVDNTEHVAPTHKIDCYKNRVALEVEWNNKDPFYDRDLNNFRLLFETSRYRRRHNHNPVHRIAADFQQARQGP